jgi:phage N-6-adenine-methyltransferase
MALRRMPIQKPGRSRQCYVTPTDFMVAVVTRFGPIDFDLAATEKNSKADRFFTLRQNALLRPWVSDPGDERLRYWLNPPYNHLRPWFAKCIEERDALTTGEILVLVPASIGSNWFLNYVWNKADVYFLKNRLCFITGEPYPKDLILCQYRNSRKASVIAIWDWKKDKLYKQAA